MIDRSTVAKLLKVMGEDCSDDSVREAINSFPDMASEKQEEQKRDFIHLSMALENPTWMMIGTAEPYREIDVRMTYEDLAEIYRRL